MTGFKVKPDYLEDAADKLDGLAGKVAAAKGKLASDGDLPTLDPLSRAMAAVAGVAGFALTGPAGVVVGPLAYAGGKDMGAAASGALDPYPGVRDAWLNALSRYQRLFERDADELRKSSKTYKDREHANKGEFRDLMPRVPGAPTSPMPRVPGSPTVPMPKPDLGPGVKPGGNVPV